MVSRAQLGIRTLSIELMQKDYEWISQLKNKGETWESFLKRAAGTLAQL